MIRDAIKKNECVSPCSFEYEKLKSTFPQYFDKTGNFDFDKFKENLTNKGINFSKESFGLNFLGKQYARLQTGIETETVISPDVEHNNQPENKNSENIYIKGDNLDALRHLLKSYSGKKRCCYIDPPYNTGSDGFVYPDNFEYSKNDLIDKMGLSEEEAERILNLSGKNTHSAWLTFMLPRLTLARELLADDGVIFISIDDNEVNNLKELCDTCIFGEDNFLATQIVTSAPAGTQSSTDFAIQQSYCLVYRKNSDFHTAIIPLTEEEIKEKFSYDSDDKGWFYIERLWKRGVGGRMEDVPSLHFPVYYDTQKDLIYVDNEIDSIKEKNDIVKIIPYQTEGVLGRWTWSKTKMIAEREFLKVVIVAGEYKLHKKVYYNEDIGKKPYTIISSKIGRTELGSIEVKDLFGCKVFDYPKYSEFVKYMINMQECKDAIVLDFFSGSATTAHSVMQLNAEDGGNRKYIMVNIPEPLKEDSEAYRTGRYKTICDIGIDRIKRAAKKIKEETNANIDYGFKIFTLNTPSEITIDKCLNFDENAIKTVIADDYVDYYKFDNVDGRETILQTWKVDDGYGFNAKHKEIDLDNYTAYLCEKTLYLINKELYTNNVKKLLELLDTELAHINQIVIFGYSFTFTELQELKTNIKCKYSNNSDEKIIITERY